MPHAQNNEVAIKVQPPLNSGQSQLIIMPKLSTWPPRASQRACLLLLGRLLGRGLLGRGLLGRGLLLGRRGLLGDGLLHRGLLGRGLLGRLLGSFLGGGRLLRRRKRRAKVTRVDSFQTRAMRRHACRDLSCKWSCNPGRCESGKCECGRRRTLAGGMLDSAHGQRARATVSVGLCSVSYRVRAAFVRSRPVHGYPLTVFVCLFMRL